MRYGNLIKMFDRYSIKRFPIKFRKRHNKICEMFFQEMLKIGIEFSHRIESWKAETALEYDKCFNKYEYFEELVTIETSLSKREFDIIEKEWRNPFKPKTFGFLDLRDNTYKSALVNENGSLESIPTKDITLDVPEDLNVFIRGNISLKLVVKLKVY